MEQLQAFVQLKDINKIENVTCYMRNSTGSEEVHPSLIFEEYQTLDDLIDINRRPVRVPLSVVRKVLQKTNNFVAEGGNGHSFETNIEYGQDHKETFEVRLRTNFERSLLKRPSIVELTTQNCPVLILREARTYPESMLGPVFKTFPQRTRTLYTDRRIEPRRANLVTELALVQALEQLYAKGFPRVTLPVKIIDNDSRTMHYVRPFIGTAWRDVSFNAEMAGKYLGLMHSYGLVEWDRNDRQYVVFPVNGECAVVNIDPDLFIWTTKEDFHADDIRDFLNVIKEDIYSTISKGEIAMLKDVRRKTIKANRDNAHELYKELKTFY